MNADSESSHCAMIESSTIDQSLPSIQYDVISYQEERHRNTAHVFPMYIDKCRSPRLSARLDRRPDRVQDLCLQCTIRSEGMGLDHYSTVSLTA